MNRLKKFASIPQKALGTENPGLWKVFLWFHFDNLTIFAFSLALAGKVASESISLEIPVDVVPDSTKAYVTVLGKQLEILGSKRKNGVGGCQGEEWGWACGPI